MNSELKLSLENFQSISEGELIFKPGLNFIIGQSNSGKSATFRALKACLTNPVGSQAYIKNGTKNTSVQLEYNNNEIIWKRTPKESSYTINGEDYIKTGRSNAIKIMTDETGFVQHTNGDLMNIEEELQLPFPFGFSGGDLFKLFENVFCISDSAVILKSAKSHEEEVKSKVSNIEADIVKNNRKIEELKKFKEDIDLDLLNEMLGKLKNNKDELLNLNSGLDLIKLAVRVQQANIRIDNYETEDKVIVLKNLKDLAKTIFKLKKLHTLMKQLPSTIEFLNKSNKLIELEKLSREVRRLEELSDIELVEIPFKDRIDEYTNLSKVRSEAKKLKAVESITLPSLTIVDKSSKLKELYNDLGYINNFKKEVKELTNKKKEFENRLKELEGQLKEYKVCPLCGNAIEGEK